MSDLPHVLPTSLIQLTGPALRAVCHAYGHEKVPYTCPAERMIAFLTGKINDPLTRPWAEVKQSFVARLRGLVSTQVEEQIRVCADLAAATAGDLSCAAVAQVQELFTSMRTRRNGEYLGTAWR